MENEILESLTILDSKPAELSSVQTLQHVVNEPFSVDFANLVHWFSMELQRYCKLEESVNKVASQDDISSFYLELRSFLRELNCPYSTFTDGAVTDSLSSADARLQLISYLASELQAACMQLVVLPQTSTASANTMQITESETAALLRVTLTSLGFPKPPPNITSQQIFTKIVDKIKEQLSKVPKGYLGDPAFTGVLSEKQWHTLIKINEAMVSEYMSREDVLLKRLDVTMQSFTWSDRVKKYEEELQKIYQPARKMLKMGSRISIANMLAARTDLLEIEKTSGVEVRLKTKSKINTIVMRGKVPDRGGRTDEIEPPPPEMPSWQQRSAGGGRGGGLQAPRQQSGRGGRGGGDQSRVQSNWGTSGGGHADNWGYAQNQYAAYGNQQPAYGGGGGGGYGQQAYYGQQQGAVHYQDFYGTGTIHQQPYQQQWTGDYGHHRGRGGGRGGGGRGGGYR